MTEEKEIKLNPIRSLFVTIWNFTRGKILFPKEFNGLKIMMEDGQQFEIFRHVILNPKTEIPENSAIFIVRFKLNNMSIKKNIRFSKFPIPMFIGLPGFKAKFWMCDEESGYNQGIYQWESEKDAINYSKSFAVKFMTRRSNPNSVAYKIIKNLNVYDYIQKLKFQ